MDTLSEILSSRSRAQIFKLLFGGTENELHVREIQRRSGLNDSTLRQELRKLVRLDLVKGRKDSNRVYYRANTENPLYPEIRNLVTKTTGVVGVLREALQDGRIHVAFVFGSIAGGEVTAGSDVDLLVIGEIGFRDLSELLSGCSEVIGREINPHVMNKIEYRKRVESGEHFMSHILKSRKIFVVGTEHDLKAMGR
ncbi:nucleotidyltransferase domain-containing protein [Shewanella sp. CG12_big_fil_rev_8_21_14_0_65_47_15]|uniref:nucleotidyltransferase domain-containing protein n=1 Tax=Shewanella sp. CG12_big_fil_rev_8_21_14_0_65_47_15 TaxID=1975537 RepID=UPI000CAA5DE1|nr:nucleotidyltransferase domain-containing protein [Shewanella sp. CG12_big_fil_rev_8_21_14_0_65_47_15]PIW61017.1 MAG: toxin-antitoxin system toxin subunit [Shewanella sp. CG12_big_fil_rev_8_21_14_0_65_47_15]